MALRQDFTADDLRRLARAGRDAGQGRRLLALAEIYHGGSRTDAARITDDELQGLIAWLKAPDEAQAERAVSVLQREGLIA